MTVTWFLIIQKDMPTTGSLMCKLNHFITRLFSQFYLSFHPMA